MPRDTKYTKEVLQRAKALRADGVSWPKITKIIGNGAKEAGLRNALSKGEGGLGGTGYREPKQVRPWPVMDFKPDELEPRYS